MINSIMKIGQYVELLEGKPDSIDNFIQDPNEKNNIHKVIMIVLNKGDLSYVGVEIEGYRNNYLKKYLYRHGSSRGTDITPTSKYAGNISTTFKNKILKCLKNISKNGKKIGLNNDELEIVTKIYNTIENSKNDIIDTLNKRIVDIDKKEGAILTLVFVENEIKHYVGDINLFQKVLQYSAKEKYFNKYNKKSLGKNQICSVCKQNQPEVYGFVNTYNFYTIDKPGFVSGGFNHEDAWKNFPVCYKCAIRLELGKKYINEKLIFNFYGFKYMIIPKFFNNENIEEILEILEHDFETKQHEIMNISYKNESINRLTSAENEIFEIISEQKNYVSFDLLFYFEKQAAFNILLHIEDVLPSRLKKLFQTKKRLDQIDIFKDLTTKENKRVIIFNFSILRLFFPRISKKRSSDKYFLEITEKIFSLKAIDYYFILKTIMIQIRSSFIKDEYLKINCLKAYLLLNYLTELGILYKGGVSMNIHPIKNLQDSFKSPDTKISEKIEHFFDSHKGFFNNSEKKASFLVGILIQFLLNIQYEDKGVTPFRSKLQGLKLTEALLKKIAIEAQEKLEQYNKNYYKELENVIAQYMVSCGSKWSLSNEEISFYFTMGMNLSSYFKTKKEK